MTTLDALLRDRAARDEPVCLFAYDLDGLRRHVTEVVAALPPRCRMYYAMKANSAAPVLETLAPIVAGFEVASGGEIAKVRAVAPAAPILFGGPAKTPAEIGQALDAAVTRLHVESVLELHRISAAAVARGTTVEVLLRVNLAGPFPSATLAMAGRPTQFGIDEADLPAATAAATTLPGLRFAGFHLHSLSNNLSAETHLEMLGLYRDTVVGWEKELGVVVEVLDVGGGIGIDYQDPAHRFDWDGFTRGLGAWVDSVPAHWREIQFECGRYLTAACRELRRRGARREAHPRHGVGARAGRDPPLPAARLVAAQPPVHGAARGAVGPVGAPAVGHRRPGDGGGGAVHPEGRPRPRHARSRGSGPATSWCSRSPGPTAGTSRTTTSSAIPTRSTCSWDGDRA